jgi:glucosamine--fructose-6-phosphate aminotransferase (isomerizing)
MCGIVGVVAERNATPILIRGLQRLEYRGYDSAGVAVLDSANAIQRCREVGKVQKLSRCVSLQSLFLAAPVSPTPVGQPTAR